MDASPGNGAYDESHPLLMEPMRGVQMHSCELTW